MKNWKLLLLIVVLGAAAVWMMWPDSARPTETTDAPTPTIADAGKNAARRLRKVAVRKDEDDADACQSPEERRLEADIAQALDREDFRLAKRCASQAMVCTKSEIRQSMVEALGWFGAKALPELTPFMADPDEDVAKLAMERWEQALEEIEDEGEKISLVEMAMKVLSDEDALDSLSNAYIGVDETLAVESLVRIIEDGGSVQGVEKAKETYEFVTGETFAGRTAAARWIAEQQAPPEAP